MNKFRLNMFLLVLPLLFTRLKLCQAKKPDAISDKTILCGAATEYLQSINITIDMENYIETGKNFILKIFHCTSGSNKSTKD